MSVFGYIGSPLKNWAYPVAEGKEVKFSTIELKNEEGHGFAHFVPSIYNFASACASGSFATAADNDPLLKGTGNIAKVLRQKAVLDVEIKSIKGELQVLASASTSDKPIDAKQNASLQGKIKKLDARLKILESQEDAWNKQVKYLKKLALNFVHFETLGVFNDHEAAAEHLKLIQTEVDSQAGYWKKRDLKKAIANEEKKYQALKTAYASYDAVLTREGVNADQNIFNVSGSSASAPQAHYSLNAYAAKFAIRPGMFASHDAADLACQVMAVRLRGKSLPKKALILLPENPSHKKIPGYVKVSKALKAQAPTEFPSVTVAMTKDKHQFTKAERVAPVLATVLGVVFTVATSAMMGAFIFLLFTPLGAPLWAIALMTAVVFVVDLINNRDDWQGRTARIIDPFKRAWNSLFHRNSFEHRVNEKLSVPRALLTGFIALVIGFDLGLIGAGGALGFKEFWESQSLARVHPVGMMIMTVIFALFVVNSMLAPLFGEAFSRIGLFFRQPIEKHKVDLGKERALMLENQKYLDSSNDATAHAEKMDKILEDDEAISESDFDSDADSDADFQKFDPAKTNPAFLGSFRAKKSSSATPCVANDESVLERKQTSTIECGM